VAYRADIEIAVKGAQELKRLQNEIRTAADAVNSLNSNLSGIANLIPRSFNNLSKTVADAAKSFNAAALGTDEATEAARKYVQATDELNAGLRERVALLAKVRAEQRITKPGDAGTGQQTPALPPELIRTYEIRQNWVKFFDDAARVAVDLRARSLNTKASWNDFFATAAQAAVNVKANSLNTKASWNDFFATAAQAAVNVKANSLNTKASWNDFFATAAQAAVNVKANSLNTKARWREFFAEAQELAVELKLQAQRTSAPAGGFPVAGPLQSPGFVRTQKKVGKFGENLALGAGFPLLFGGGPGAVAGSVLGSFVGSGFGGQILGGAIGQILDQAIQKTAQLGSALQTLDLSKIEESGVRINANLQTQITLLRQAGAATSAQQLLQQQVLNTTGALPGTVEGVSNAVNVLSSSWSEFTATAGVTLGIIGAPFAAALGAIINAVNLILKGVNFTFSAIGGALKLTGEWVVELVGGQKAVENIRRAFVSLNTEIENARKQYQPILADLNSEVLLTRQILDLEKQKTAGQTTADKQRNVNLTFQQNIARLNARIDEEIRVANEKITEATKAQVTEQVRLLNVKRAQGIENEKLTLQLERERIALDAQEKAARAAEKARKTAEDAARSEQQIQERLRALKREAELTRQIGTVKELQFRAEMDGNKELQIRLQGEERIIQIMQGTAQALDGITDQRLRQAVLSKAATEIDAARQETVFEMERLESERTKTYEQTIADLELELKLKTATTEQERERLRLEAERAKLKGKGFTDEQIGIITGLQAQVAAPLTDAQKIEQHIGKLKDEVADLTNIGNIAITVADGIGTAFSQAFQGLISGSMTAKEALGSFFKSVGDMFVEMAAQIIAKQMTMIILQTILKALGAVSSASSVGAGAFNFGGAPGVTFNPGAFSMPALAANGATFANGIAKFASGGIVSSPTLFKFADGGTTRTGLMGEAGPEAIMPLKRGSDGSLGVQANGLREAMNQDRAAGGGTPVLNMSFQSTNIGGVEYVSRDQLEAAMEQTRRDASRDGAKRGMTMTLDRIQNSSSTRRRIGV